jgi:hypothetical protein
MNAKPLIALAALVLSAGAFAQGPVQAERDFYVAQATPATGKSRAEVLAEIAQARRSGELERIRGDYYGFESTQPSTTVWMAKRDVAKMR